MSNVKIGIGSVQFGLDYGISNSVGKTSADEVAFILKIAKNYGIETIDTARSYGVSEKILGMNCLKGFKLVTKFITSKRLSIKEQLDESLKQLKLENIYALLAHHPLEIVCHPKLWREMEMLKFSGKVEKIGFSFNTPDEIDEILKLKIKPDLIQIPYNYLDSRFIPYIEHYKNSCEIHS